MHPKDRLKKASKQQEHHPRSRMKHKEGQIARGNVSKLIRAEFDFNPPKSIK